ncbi:uncharacterized protein LOC124120732 isoform X2 [Haliotis rufescens]|uniref:uncharacterized protein LOC124120732 isoform X2 n=1 Tax=Haliotis rufescens TaxID=6454 RepID=UPI00201EE1C5|nr:uncharacterized protein LOC124120732 isoform X2 [Haliotis rufescens]
MGVTNLWTILAPVKQHTPLSSLRGQTIAVDLSIWVCENQCVKSMQGVVARPYLRNLFFRVSYLTQLGVKLVFVIEGAAPQLKWQEMRRRQQALGRGRGGRAGGGGRSNFNARLRECCQLLDLLGIPYIHSRGEAEAMCAALDAAGLVDACITDDGDVFLYGARTVYKNFTMNNKDPHVESFSMAAIEQDLGVSRESLVGVALLLGCDYLPGGVPGVGVERVIKYLQSLKGVDILKRFRQWEQMTVSQCVSKIEIFIRQKSLATPDFPQAQVIEEFLSKQETTPKKAFTWRRPHIAKTQEYAETKMEWPPDYTTEKVLPLVTLWDLVHMADTTLKNLPYLKPNRVVKPRVRHGVPVYEVEWFKSVDDVNTSSEFYTTMEEQGLFARAFPDLVHDLEEELAAKKVKKKKGTKKSKKKEPPEDELGDLSSQMLLLELQGDGDTRHNAQMDSTQCAQQASCHIAPANSWRDGNQRVQSNSHHLKKAPPAQGPVGVPGLTAKSRRKPIDIKGVDELDVRVKQETKTSRKTSSKGHTVSDCPDEDVLYSKTQYVTELGAQDESAKRTRNNTALHESRSKTDSLYGIQSELKGTPNTSTKHSTGGDVPYVIYRDASEISEKYKSYENSDKNESDSDSEVFLSLSQRLQLKLGQSTKGQSVSGGFEQCLALKQHTMTKCISESGVDTMQRVRPVRTRKSEQEKHVVTEPSSKGASLEVRCFKKPILSCETDKKPVMNQLQGREKKDFADLSKPVLSRCVKDQPINGITHDLASHVTVLSMCDSSKCVPLSVDTTDCRLRGKCSHANVKGQDGDSLAGTGPPLTDLSRDDRSGVETFEGSNKRSSCHQPDGPPAVVPPIRESLAGTDPPFKVETREGSPDGPPAVSDFTSGTYCGEHDFSHVACMTVVHTPDIPVRPSRPASVSSGASPDSLDLPSAEKIGTNHLYLNGRAVHNTSSNTLHNSYTNTLHCHDHSSFQINSSSSPQILNGSPHPSNVSPKPMKPFSIKSHLFNLTPSPLTRAKRPPFHPLTPETGPASGHMQKKVLLYQTPSPSLLVRPCIPDSVHSRPAHTNQTILYQTPSPAFTSAVDSTLQFGNFSMQASLLNDSLANMTASSTSIKSSFVSYRSPICDSQPEGRPSIGSPINLNMEGNENCLPSCGGVESTTCDGSDDIDSSFQMLSLDSKSSSTKVDVSTIEGVASRRRLIRESSESSTPPEIGKNTINQDILEHDVHTNCSEKHDIVAQGNSSEKCGGKTSKESAPGTDTGPDTSSDMKCTASIETDDQIMLSSQSQVSSCSQRTLPNKSKLSLRRKGSRSGLPVVQHEVLPGDSACDSACDSYPNLGEEHQKQPMATSGRSRESDTDEQSTWPDSVKSSTEDSVIDLCEDSDSEVGDCRPMCVPTKCFVPTDKVFPKALEGDRTFLQMLHEPSGCVKVSAKQPFPNFYEDSDSDTLPEWETETTGDKTPFTALNNDQPSRGKSLPSKDCFSGVGTSTTLHPHSGEENNRKDRDSFTKSGSEGYDLSGASSFSSKDDSPVGSSMVQRDLCVHGLFKRDSFVTETDNGCSGSRDVSGAAETTMMESPVSLSDRLKLRLSNDAQSALKALSSRRNFGLDVNVKPLRRT